MASTTTGVCGTQHYSAIERLHTELLEMLCEWVAGMQPLECVCSHFQ